MCASEACVCVSEACVCASEACVCASEACVCATVSMRDGRVNKAVKVVQQENETPPIQFQYVLYVRPTVLMVNLNTKLGLFVRVVIVLKT